MTQPTVIYFGPDGRGESAKAPPKVYLRSLLYCTSRRGRIVQSLYVKLRRGETLQTFNIWVLGEEKLARGSGLFVGQEGVTCNHHFLLPEDGTSFSFLSGDYRLEVFATIVGVSRPLLLGIAHVQVSESIAGALKSPRNGVYFDWGSDSSRYHAHVRSSPKVPALPAPLLALLATEEDGAPDPGQDLVPEGVEGHEKT